MNSIIFISITHISNFYFKPFCFLAYLIGAEIQVCLRQSVMIMMIHNSFNQIYYIKLCACHKNVLRNISVSYVVEIHQIKCKLTSTNNSNVTPFYLSKSQLNQNNKLKVCILEVMNPCPHLRPILCQSTFDASPTTDAFITHIQTVKFHNNFHA